MQALTPTTLKEVGGRKRCISPYPGRSEAWVDGDGEEEGVKLRVMVVSNQGIKGWWIRLPRFPEVACVGDTLAQPSGP